MTVQDLINQFNGQSLTVTGPDAGQCTAIPHKWEQMLGLPIVYGNAVDTFANAGSDYTKIPNSPSGVPQAGDIVVWGQNSAIGTSNVGHTAVATGQGDTAHFTSFDQNWPTGSNCRTVYHTYDGVIGWFRPNALNKGEDMANVTVTQAQIDAWLHGPDGIDHWKVEAYNKGVEVDALKQQVSELAAQVTALQTKLASGGVQAPDSMGVAVRALIDVVRSYISSKQS